MRTINVAFGIAQVIYFQKLVACWIREVTFMAAGEIFLPTQTIQKVGPVMSSKKIFCVVSGAAINVGAAQRRTDNRFCGTGVITYPKISRAESTVHLGRLSRRPRENPTASIVLAGGRAGGARRLRGW